MKTLTLCLLTTLLSRCGAGASGYVYTCSYPVADVVFRQASYMNQRAAADLPVP